MSGFLFEYVVRVCIRVREFQAVQHSAIKNILLLVLSWTAGPLATVGSMFVPLLIIHDPMARTSPETWRRDVLQEVTGLCCSLPW